MLDVRLIAVRVQTKQLYDTPPHTTQTLELGTKLGRKRLCDAAKPRVVHVKNQLVQVLEQHLHFGLIAILALEQGL